MKILFVCDGNICRSPMAEALLRVALDDRKIDWVEASSAGLSANPFGTAHAQLRRVLGPTFHLIESRHSQPMDQRLAEQSDLILGMEDRHIREIHERFPGTKGKVHLVTTYAGMDGEILDFSAHEYGDVVSWLRHCHSIILPSVEAIVDRLVRENDSKPKKVD